jgi:hypothetical protein
VVKALDERSPKFQTVVGKGTGALLMLTRLPVGLRDKLLKNAFGLTGALKSTI